jgi:hypothetical protein
MQTFVAVYVAVHIAGMGHIILVSPDLNNPPGGALLDSHVLSYYSMVIAMSLLVGAQATAMLLGWQRDSAALRWGGLVITLGIVSVVGYLTLAYHQVIVFAGGTWPRYLWVRSFVPIAIVGVLILALAAGRRWRLPSVREWIACATIVHVIWFSGGMWRGLAGWFMRDLR